MKELVGLTHAVGKSLRFYECGTTFTSGDSAKRDPARPCKGRREFTRHALFPPLFSFPLISSVSHVTSSSHVIPAAVMKLFRPTVKSYACCKMHLCPSTLWTSSVLSPPIPLRTFHAARLRAAANKPAAPISTLTSPFLSSWRHATEKHFARRIPTTSHGIATTTSTSSSRAAALPSVDVPAESQNHLRSTPSRIRAPDGPDHWS